MKEVPAKSLPEVSGGDSHPDGCIPYPVLPDPDGIYPRNPFGPLVESPYSDGTEA